MLYIWITHLYFPLNLIFHLNIFYHKYTWVYLLFIPVTLFNIYLLLKYYLMILIGFSLNNISSWLITGFPDSCKLTFKHVYNIFFLVYLNTLKIPISKEYRYSWISIVKTNRRNNTHDLLYKNVKLNCRKFINKLIIYKYTFAYLTI